MNWVSPLFLTIQLMLVSVSIAAILGISGAWAGSVLQTGGRTARLIAAVFAASMLFAIALPLVLHAGTWESTAGKFGWLMLTQTGARADGTSRYGIFSGLLAAGWIHALYGTAIVTLTTWYGIQRTPQALLQQSRMDLTPSATWWRVRLPLAIPWVSLGLLITGLLAATEMTVADLYGFRTIADEFYLFYASNPTLLSLVVTCAIPMAGAAVLVGGLLRPNRRSINNQVDDGIDDVADNPIGNDRHPTVLSGLATILAVGLAILIVAVPLCGMVIKLGHDVTVEADQVRASWSGSLAFSRMMASPAEFSEEYQWTAIIGVLAGLLALVIATPLAMLGRIRPKVEPWLDAITIVAFVVPGPIVGLVVVRFFRLDVPGFDQLYQQTLIPLLLALMVRGVPVAYWILRSAYRSIADSVLDASQLDAGGFRRFFVIDRPLLARGWLAAGLAAAVVASGDLPVTLPVMPPNVTTVGTRLFGLLHSGARYQEAALSVWYVLSIVVISAYFFRQSRTLRYKVK